MKKISFDIEDHPPPSYYKENDSVHIGQQQFVGNVKNQPVAFPSNSSIDKTEWWKAPEFVPKSKMVELPSVHQLQHDNSARLKGHHHHHHPSIADQPPLHIEKQQQQVLINNNSSNSNSNSNNNNLIRNVQHFQQPGFAPLPMPPIMTNPNLMRSYPPPPPMFSMPPGMARPFLPPVPLLPPALQQFSPFQRQPTVFRAPARPSPRSVVMNNTGIPSGYTANMTTINAGLGAQIPAIVIKKKRKKKSRKLKETSHIGAADNDKTEPLSSEQKSKESSPDDQSSTPTSLIETGRSEPDLMTLHNKSGGTLSNFPADLDLIQSTANCAMLTGSWPDLSEPQRQMLHNKGVYSVYYDEDDQTEDADVVGLNDHDDEQEEAILPDFVKQWDDDDLIENQTLLSNDKRQQQLCDEDSRKVIVRSTGDGTSTTELLPKNSLENFKRPLRSFSLPDVPLVSGDRSKVCCSIM